MKKILALLFLAATTCRALIIGFFPGLDALIEQADAIVVLRIDRYVTPYPGPSTYTTHHCYVYQSIKGEIAPESFREFHLMDPRHMLPTPFALGSTHLVFLRKSPGEPASYSTLALVGANIRLSPIGNETITQGTAADRIRALVKTAAAYGSGEQKREDEFLSRISEGKAFAPHGAYP